MSLKKSIEVLENLAKQMQGETDGVESEPGAAGMSTFNASDSKKKVKKKVIDKVKKMMQVGKMKKAKIDILKPGQKEKRRKEQQKFVTQQRLGTEVGVHGQTGMGSELKVASPKATPHAYSQKQLAQQKIKEIKGMKAPKLPKSETSLDKAIEKMRDKVQSFEKSKRE